MTMHQYIHPKLDTIFIDTDRYSLNQQRVALCLCKDFPIDYVVGSERFRLLMS